ncbi:MAG: HD domain-containing protein [Candidatus Goldbacteria bacterium]|nr:HD domain-containing protein [Candidatus Goldiibacteriota bacterium]
MPAKKKKVSYGVSGKADKDILQKILKITEDIHNISDIDILLDKILFEVRKFTNAEAGTIFLTEGNNLRISYTQNEILFGKSISNRYKYLNHEIPINETSMAGFAAFNGQMLVVDDAYKISSKEKYTFNKDFDISSGYKTQSVLNMPLKTARNRVIGVMQIINAKNERGKVVPFSDKDELYVSYFANDAAIAIEKAISTRQMVLRMLRMVEFRDPKETGGHVNRMGAYSVEIYHQWAKDRGFPPELIRRFKDKLRIAAMLHDAGKIAIPDSILKKPAKLEPEEFSTMKMHTIFGYRLFESKDSEIDAMAAEIALAHHEKWDGTGYPGRVTDVMNLKKLDSAPGKTDLEIPVTGRIVAVADVYDALVSKRIYKEPWDETRVIEYIKDNSGKHFDPEVVDAFLNVYDVIAAIRDKYTENKEQEEQAPNPDSVK